MDRATPPPGPPPPPPVTGIDLTQFAEIVNTARTDQEQLLTTPLVATTGDGTLDLAYRGTTRCGRYVTNSNANVLVRMELHGRATQMATTGGFPDGLVLAP